MKRAIAIAILALTAVPSAAQEEVAPRLVRFTSERLALAPGGHLDPERYAVLTAQITPATEGVEVSFWIVEGTGAGRAVPAMVSRVSAATGGGGVARTVLLTSDAEEACRIAVRVGAAAPLYVRLEFRRIIDESVVVAPSASGAAVELAEVDERAMILASRLADPAVEVRTAAKRMLLAMGCDAIGALVAVAGSARTPRDARSLAVRTLAGVRDGEADEQLLLLLGHPLPDVRVGAEAAIAVMDLARAEHLGEMALGSDDELVRAAAVRILGALASESAERSALLAMSDTDPLVRATATWALSRAQCASASPAVLTALSDASPFVRATGAKAVVLLGRLHLDDPAAVAPVLGDLLDDGAPAVRAASARALGVVETGAESALTRAIGDDDVRVRRSAALAIPWRADDRSSVRMLRELVDDDDAVVRATARGAVTGMSGPAEADLLVAILDEDDEALRDRAVRALRRVTCLDFGWVRARTADERTAVLTHWRDWYTSNRTKARSAWLHQALDLPGSTLRGAAGLVLARTQPLKPSGPSEFKDRDGLRAALRRILTSTAGANAPAERHAAAEGLLLLGDGSALGVVRLDLQDPRRYVRISASRALASAFRTGAGVASAEVGVEVARSLVEALEDDSVTVRRLAVRGLRDASGNTFGYQPQGPKSHRGRGATAWRRWLAEREAAVRGGD